MNIWRLTIMDLQELLRRLRAGESRGAIVRALHISPNTVKAYRQWAEAQGLLTGSLADLATLEALREKTYLTPRVERHPNQSSLETYRAEITELVEQGRKPRTIWRTLHGRHPGLRASESAVRRMVKAIRRQHPPPDRVVLRIETGPGEVAQVDFGFVGYVLDPQTHQPRKTWAFVMVLAYSRHQYAELVFDQSLPTWLVCHRHAFEFFQGVSKRVVLDNLKAAIVKAYVGDREPEVQQAYRECAEHYGFLIDPCLPRKPQHKGKVERGGVGYLKQAFVPLLPTDVTLPEANRLLRDWCLNTAGLRVHGTTRETPLSRFAYLEQQTLQRMPYVPYDLATWKRCKLHRDGHVTFNQAYYSAPHRLLGQTLWVRAGSREIRIFSEKFELVATHSRAQQPGQRLTQADHLPPDLAKALTFSRDTCQAQANAIGPATSQVVAELLASRPIDRLRTAGRVLQLAEQHSPARLEAACQSGLAHGDPSLCTLKRILRDRLETFAVPEPTPALPLTEPCIFARDPQEFSQALLGGARWN